MIGAHLENLEKCWPHIMFRIEPRKRIVRVERCLPDEAAVVLKLHLKQWILRWVNLEVHIEGEAVDCDLLATM